MRFLKKKIQNNLLLQSFQPKSSSSQEELQQCYSTSEDQSVLSLPEMNSNSRKIQKKDSPSKSLQNRIQSTPEKYLFTKNVVRNYGKAICRFCLKPYAKEIILDIINKQKLNISYENFAQFIRDNRSYLDSTKAYISMIRLKNSDDVSLRGLKTIMRLISIIFVKNWSAQWIEESKLSNKTMYTDFSVEILKRLENPNLFDEPNPFKLV